MAEKKEEKNEIRKKNDGQGKCKNTLAKNNATFYALFAVIVQ